MGKVATSLKTIANLFSSKAPGFYSEKFFKASKGTIVDGGIITSGILNIVALVLLSIAALVLIIGIIRSIVNANSTKEDGTDHKRKAKRIIIASVLVSLILAALGMIPVIIALVAK
ncbi:hypothetical protein [Metamycoplasma buccale]|uniref:hypothetical protein n=1 Tax=Metamycoplasma buccale TaxID=55602 RepID=UPI00398E8DB9